MRKISVSSALTVFFDGQFWVGVIEHTEEGRYGAKRIVFGAEPSNEQVLEFTIRHWHELDLSCTTETPGTDSTHKDPVAHSKRRNPKRAAREAAKELRNPGPSTKAQEALSREREQAREHLKQTKAQRKEQEERSRYELRKGKRKNKHRGH